MAVLAAAAALAAGLAACSSSANNAKPATTVRSGTETAHGRLTGAAAMSGNPTFHLTMAGPVATSGTIPLGAAPQKGASHSFSTSDGKLAVTLTGAGSTHAGLQSQSTCRIAFSTRVPFTVDGPKSTGKFHGATGSGQALVTLSGNLPKHNGKCDVSRNAQPAPHTAVGTFNATMHLTVRH
ncbi:MAG TPA: hypothetical protein VFQ44_04040 [Streptosporangiaceae bacterium]|nr:hypothetical protein [Streptosporangiaceae bacterium]